MEEEEERLEPELPSLTEGATSRAGPFCSTPSSRRPLLPRRAPPPRRSYVTHVSYPPNAYAYAESSRISSVAFLFVSRGISLADGFESGRTDARLTD